MNKFSEWIIKTFWPFFRDNVWPIIKDQIISIISTAFEYFRKRIEEILNQSSREREEQAERKAQEAEEQATNAKDKAETEKYSAIAEIWRQVAEDYRQQNELLKEKLATASYTASKEIEQNIQAIQIKTEKDSIQLTSGDKTIALPASPQ
jgi:F0F1-type ATP synthase membrane subunit b/b'